MHSQTVRRFLTAATTLALVVTACGGGDAASPTEFDYDTSAPLDIEIGDAIDTPTAPETAIHSISFNGRDGVEVTGLIADPPSGSNEKAVLLLHGISQGASLASNDMIEPMRDWTCAGATTLAIDMPYARLGRFDAPYTLTEIDVDEHIQLMVDLQRSVDVLEERGSSDIAFVAISGGAVHGASFVGLEERLVGSAIILGNGGPWHRWTEFGVPSVMMMGMSDQERDEYAGLMGPYSGVHFIGDHDAPILFVNGTLDPIIGEDAAIELHEAAGDNVEVSWYESGHTLPNEAFVEVHHWVGEALGLDSSQVTECEPVFP